MPTKRTSSESIGSGHKSPRDGQRSWASGEEERLVVLREGINSRTGWESVMELLLESSEAWVISHSRRTEFPALSLDLGFREHSKLLSGHSLHHYAIATADRIKSLSGVQFSSVRLSKHHGNSTSVAVGEAPQWSHRGGAAEVTMTTRRSYATPPFVQEVEEATRSFRNILVPKVPLALHVAYTTGLPRTWSRLWGPTVSGVCVRPLQNEQIDSAQIVELGFDHLSIGEQLGHRVQMVISASRMPSDG